MLRTSKANLACIQSTHADSQYFIGNVPIPQAPVLRLDIFNFREYFISTLGYFLTWSCMNNLISSVYQMINNYLKPKFVK